MSYDGSIVGHRLTVCRINCGMSQEELAMKSGVSKDNIARYENGTTKPGLDKAYAIAVTLGVTLDQLVGLAPLIIDNKPESVTV